MAAKSLSTSTLSLKFMQNAYRAKNVQQVELDKAEVRDDGEWEIGQEMRDAWGMGAGETSTQAVSYEASYLPFLFALDEATDHSSSATKSPPKGRRVFKSGREISGIEPTVATAQHQGPESKSAQHSSSSKPRQISSGQGQATRDSWKAKPTKPIRKSARDAIFDNSAVSLGPRQTKMSNSQNTHSGFMKPDRVDEPTHKTDSVKVKRPRAADSTEPDGPVNSRKKKVRKQRSAESDAEEQ